MVVCRMFNALGKTTKTGLVAAALLAIICFGGCRDRAESSAGETVLIEAFQARKSNLQVEAEGRVSRILSDDTQGSRHQRFIVELSQGQTVLISHNIDLASRVESIKVGDRVAFSGEYEWNDKGGVVHWTHRDPDGKHAAGWIKHNGRTYQ